VHAAKSAGARKKCAATAITLARDADGRPTEGKILIAGCAGLTRPPAQHIIWMCACMPPQTVPCACGVGATSLRLSTSGTYAPAGD
jgi:hypothetical protein